MNQNNIIELFNRSAYKKTDSWATFTEFQHHMRHQLDARLLGKGWYSSVWQVGDRIYKINSGQQGERDGFIRWIHATRHLAGVNPHIPWVGQIVTDDNLYCIELEPLAPVEYEFRKPVNQMSEKDFADYAANKPQLIEALEFAHDLSRVAWPSRNYEPSPSLATKIGELDYCQGSFSNLMHRNGVIVINDPLSYSEEKIGTYAHQLANGLMQCAA